MCRELLRRERVGVWCVGTVVWVYKVCLCKCMVVRDVVIDYGETILTHVLIFNTQRG